MRLAPLDGLRGIAALGIVLMHAFPSWTFWMWSFVDLFFVLSGYLITDILLRADLSNATVLRNFWARRILRIWPVYYLALLMAMGIGLLQSADDPTPWWRCFTFLQFTEAYTDGPGIFPRYAWWFRHSWSLAIEEQFYLAWPLVLILCRKSRPAMLAACLGLIAAAVWMRSQHQLVVLLGARVDGLALGSVLALMRSSAVGRPLSTRLNLRPLYAAAVLLPLAWIGPYLWGGYVTHPIRTHVDIGAYGDFTSLVIAFALLHFGVVGLLLDGALPRLAAALSRPVLLALGAISYGLYMYNGIFITLAYRASARFGLLDGNILLGLLAISGTFAAALLSRTYLERPLERFKAHFPLKAPLRAPRAIPSLHPAR